MFAVGWLDRIDKRNQHALHSQREALTPKQWEQKWRDEANDEPGPTWAAALSTLPLIGWIGDLVMLGATWRQRRKGDDA